VPEINPTLIHDTADKKTSMTNKRKQRFTICDELLHIGTIGAD